MYIKSPLNYIGGKYKLLDNLFEVFPTNIDTFVDLFAGGFNVGINVLAKKIICNDHINYLIDLYQEFHKNSTQKILSRINDRITEYNLNQENADNYIKFRNNYNKGKDVLDLFILTCYAFNHQIRFNNNKQFNTPFGKNRSSYNSAIENNLHRFLDALHSKNISFSSLDFMDFNFDELTPDDFVYCDPPYLISNSSYNDGKRGFKNWTSQEEIALLNVLDKLNTRRIKFALSNVLYHKNTQNNILIEWSKKYNVLFLDKEYSNCNYHLKDKTSKTVEVLILNYTPEKDIKCHQKNLI